MLPLEDIQARSTGKDGVQTSSDVTDTLVISSPQLESPEHDQEVSQEAHFWPNLAKLDAEHPEQARAD